MDPHDELAALLSQHLTFRPEDPREQPPLPNYSVSQHYTHSAWTSSQERPSSEPPAYDPTSETILRNHGIDPSTLTPSQISLFKVADAPQKRRLLELWSICPPNQGADIPALAWSSTTLEHEEQLARLRYERMQQHQFVPQQPQPQPEPEPYMSSGYEELMRREREREAKAQLPAKDVYRPYGSALGGSSPYSPATDPVYLGPDCARERQQMEMATQYGSFERFRSNSDGDAMVMDVM